MVIKSFAKLFAGNVAVQVMTLLFYPILGRLYAPADFGFLGVLSSLAVVLSIFGSGQLHMAFPQVPEGHEDGRSLLRLCFSYSLVSILIVTVLSFFGAFNFLFSTNEMSSWWIIPLFTLAYSFNEITKMWLIYLRKYGMSSVFVSSNRLISNLLKVFSPQVLGLVFSEVLTNLIGVISSLKMTKFSLKGTQSLKTTLKKFAHYPGFYTFGSLAQALQQELPVFMIKKIFAANVVGLYVVANKFTVQSVLLVSASLILVLANKQGASGKDRIISELKRILKFILPITIVIFFVLRYYGESIFGIFLGDKWQGIGEISSYLSLLIFPKMLFIPIYAEILRSGRVKLLSLLRGSQIILAFIFFQLVQKMDFLFIIKGYVLFDFTSDIIITGLSLYFISQSKQDGHRANS